MDLGQAGGEGRGGEGRGGEVRGGEDLTTSGPRARNRGVSTERTLTFAFLVSSTIMSSRMPNSDPMLLSHIATTNE